jgi:hypothetical protein
LNPRLELIARKVDADPDFLTRVRICQSPDAALTADLPPAFLEAIDAMELLGEAFCPIWGPIRGARFLFWGYGASWWAQALEGGTVYRAPQRSTQVARNWGVAGVDYAVGRPKTHRGAFWQGVAAAACFCAWIVFVCWIAGRSH